MARRSAAEGLENQTDCSDQTLRQIVASTGMKRMLVSAKFGRRVESLAESLGIPLDVESLASQDRPLRRLAEIDPSRSGRHHVHLRLDRRAEGRHGHAPQHRVQHPRHPAVPRPAADDRVMVVLPFYYCYGTSLLHTHLMAGASLVLNNRFMFPEKVLDEMERDGAARAWPACPPRTRSCCARRDLPSGEFPALRWLQQAGGQAAQSADPRNSPGASRT